MKKTSVGTRQPADVPTISLGQTYLEVKGGGTFNVVINRTGELSYTSSVKAYTITGTANETDYEAISGQTVEFLPTETTKTITVATNLDIPPEGYEEFYFKIANPVNAVLGNVDTVMALQPSDEIVTITVNSITVSDITEGNNAVFTVTLNQAVPAGQTRSIFISRTGTVASQYLEDPVYSNGVYVNPKNVGGSPVIVPAGVSQFTVTYVTVTGAAVGAYGTINLQVGSGSATAKVYPAVTPVTLSSITSPTVNEGQLATMTVTLSGTTTQQLILSATIGSIDTTPSVHYVIPVSYGNGVTVNEFFQLVVPVGISSFIINVSTLITDKTSGTRAIPVTLSGAFGDSVTGNVTINYIGSTSSMAIGANSDWLNDWETSGSTQRVNLAESMRLWSKASGAGTIANQTWGAVQLTTTDTLVESVFFVRSGYYPDLTLAGDYEIWAQLESGSGGAVTVQGLGFSTLANTATLDTTFKRVGTFSYNPIVGAADHNQLVRFTGTTNKLIKLYIGKPEHLAQWNAGNVWHPDFIARVASRSHWRSMNQFYASVTVEKSIAHRALPSHIRKLRAPIEDYLDLCARAITKPYLNLPQMMDVAYAESVGDMLDAWLTNRNTEVLIAHGNEMTFNTAPPWRQGYYWAASETLTKYDSAIDTDGSILATAHGLVNGDKVYVFTHHDDIEATNLGQAFPFGNGFDPLVQVKNANAFFILNNGTPQAKPSVQTRVIWAKEPSGFNLVTANLAGKATQHVRIAEAINSRLSVPNLSKVKYVIEGQSVDSGKLATVLANIPANKKDAVYHYASIAPYSNGVSYGVKVLANNGSIELSLIGINSLHYKQRVYYGLYPVGSTSPTNDEVIAGTGAIDFGSYLIPDANFTVLPYSVVDTMTGSNGTEYNLICVSTIFANPSYLVSKNLFTDITLRARVEVPFTLTASSVTHFGDMTHADKLEFDKLAMKYAALDLQEHVAVAEGRPLWNYEDGSHYDGLQNYTVAPESKLHYHEWLKNYLNNSADGAEWFERLYHTYAVYAIGATYYKSGTTGPFLVDGNYVTGKTQRSTMLDSYNKQIPRYSKLPNLAVNSVAVPAAPSSYPSTIHALIDEEGDNTLDSGSITYSIASDTNEFVINGNNLQVTNAVAGLFSPPTIRRVIIKSETPKLSNFNEITVQFGEYVYVPFYTNGNVNIPATNVDGNPTLMRQSSSYTEINTATEKGVTATVGGRYWSYTFDISGYIDTIAANELVTMKGRFACSLALNQLGDYLVSIRVFDRTTNTPIQNFGTTGWQAAYGTSIANAPESTLTFQFGAQAFNSTDHIILFKMVSNGTITDTSHTMSIFNLYKA